MEINCDDDIVNNCSVYLFREFLGPIIGGILTTFMSFEDSATVRDELYNINELLTKIDFYRFMESYCLPW